MHTNWTDHARTPGNFDVGRKTGRRPNLLLIQTDQQKATSLDLYNQQANFIPTTSVRQIAEAGTTFETGYCPYPLCVPSRISMMTGQWPSRSGYIGNRPDLEETLEAGRTVPDTLFHAAKRAGCRTLLVGKDHCFGGMHARGPLQEQLFDRQYNAAHVKQSPETKRDQPHIQPFLDSHDQLRHVWGAAVAPWHGDRSVTGQLSDVACEYLHDWAREDREANRPFAMWLSYPDPHEPYQAPQDCFEAVAEYVTLYPNDQMSDEATRAQYIRFMRWYFNAGDGCTFTPPSEAVRRQLVQVYLAMCLNIDRQMSKVLQTLRDLGEWENTLIVFCSDHGDLTGELGLLQKFNCGYDGCCRVPLVVAYPGQFEGGQRASQPVNLIDLAATVCDVLAWPDVKGNQGQSLAPILATGHDPDRLPYTVIESGVPCGPAARLTTADIRNFPEHRWDRAPVKRWCYDPPHRFGGRMYAVRSAEHKLIVREGDRPEFYDMKSDPWETRNLARHPAVQGTMLQHQQWLIEHLGRAGAIQPNTAIAAADQWYVAGGDRTWGQSIAEPNAHDERTSDPKPKTPQRQGNEHVRLAPSARAASLKD